MTGSSKGALTRSRMVEAMLSLVQSRGYAGTGLNAVLEAAAVPKGSLYFHFPGGKEELGVHAVGLAAEQYRAMIAAGIEAGVGAGSRPAEVVGAVLDLVADLVGGADFEMGCPVSVVTLEAGSRSERLRQACTSAYDSWIALVDEYLTGEGLPADEAAALAETVVSTVEGALIVSRARRDVSALRSARRVLVEVLDERFRTAGVTE